jgi:hypothetical protein
MPTLELHGYGEQGARELIADARERLQHLEYRGTIVFDTTRMGGCVEGWDGSERPFVRVCSRSQAKLDELRDCLVALSDIETLLIGYFPRADGPV